MAVKYPTVDEVKQTFAESIPRGEPFDEQTWARLKRAVMNPTWQPAGDGIEVLQAHGARLVNVCWVFTIDKMNTSSENALRSSAAALRQRLLALVNGEPASFDEPESETQDGTVRLVRCWTRGIVG